MSSTSSHDLNCISTSKASWKCQTVRLLHGDYGQNIIYYFHSKHCIQRNIVSFLLSFGNDNNFNLLLNADNEANIVSNLIWLTSILSFHVGFLFDFTHNVTAILCREYEESCALYLMSGLFYTEGDMVKSSWWCCYVLFQCWRVGSVLPGKQLFYLLWPGTTAVLPTTSQNVCIEYTRWESCSVIE